MVPHRLTGSRRATSIALVAFILATAATFASASSAVPAQVRAADPTILHRGSNLPTGAKPPLVVMMGHSTPSAVDAQTHWVDAADRYNLAVAIPQGGDRNLGWSDRTGELAYLETSIPAWIRALGADPNKVYLTGFSAGSNMAFYAASHASSSQLPLAGIAPDSGWMDRGFTLARTTPTRLFYMLGSGDVVGPSGNNLFYSMDEVAGYFARLNGCGSASAQRSASGVLQQKSWTCGVDSYVVSGGGHCWPGAAAQGTGCHVADLQFSATDMIAKWVLQGPLASLTVTYVRANVRLTPGAVNPAVRQSSIRTTICRRGWASRVKPTTAYLKSLKLKQMGLYHAAGSPSAYVEDHLIPLELGGSPKDPKNLWPEPAARAHAVDLIEHQLNRQVCSGRLKLATARSRIVKLKHTSG